MFSAFPARSLDARGIRGHLLTGEANFPRSTAVAADVPGVNKPRGGEASSANANDDPLVQTVAGQAEHGRRPVERDGEVRVLLGEQHPAWFPARV